ncbi:hypothetical protein QQS21_000588 [Conoideocrella luteorostrata]|uniref:Uncharacterized protein n=1 Tax=Conoideocrella luteorostrata TaxID=1105319 RepID=A0AAJ0D165_9HYPO|nr:hypothetical protein QQS21_000588 [Conoideocrella luteorostrata]
MVMDFVLYVGSDWHLYVASEGFVNGAHHFGPGAVLWAPGAFTFGYGSQANITDYFDSRKAISREIQYAAGNGATWKRLEVPECLSQYVYCAGRETMRNVIWIVKSHNSSGDDSDFLGWKSTTLLNMGKLTQQELSYLTGYVSDQWPRPSTSGLEEDAFAFIGYSTLMLLILLLIIVTLVSVPFVLAMKKARGQTPNGGSNSKVISAACHVPVIDLSNPPDSGMRDISSSTTAFRPIIPTITVEQARRSVQDSETASFGALAPAYDISLPDQSTRRASLVQKHASRKRDEWLLNISQAPLRWGEVSGTLLRDEQALNSGGAIVMLSKSSEMSEVVKYGFQLFSADFGVLGRLKKFIGARKPNSGRVGRRPRIV